MTLKCIDFVLQKEAVMQTNALGPLVAVGSWLAARNIPKTLYADIAWSWMDIPCDEEHVDL